MKHPLMACIYVVIFSCGSPLYATTAFLYVLINKTGLPVQVSSHNLSLKEGKVAFLIHPEALKKLVLNIETEEDPVKLKFTPPLSNSCLFELYYKPEDNNQEIDLFMGADQTQNEHPTAPSNFNGALSMHRLNRP